MTRAQHTASAPRSSALMFTPTELQLPETAKHDEWLLDEALDETFPASDPIAVSCADAQKERRE